MRTSTFHAAGLDSPRLQKLLAFLRECGPAGATGMEICCECATTRPSSDVSELRHAGIQIKTIREYVFNANGRKRQEKQVLGQLLTLDQKDGSAWFEFFPQKADSGG